jgi:RNA polymerase sigma-70 factor (ECF subfamily)
VRASRLDLGPRLARPGPSVNARGLHSISPTTPHRGDTIDAERAGSDATAIRGWIEAAQAGDADAFDHLARHALPSLRRWALVRTGDPDDADDVVQRTLVRAYTAIDSLRGAQAFHGWLYAIMRNVASELGRRARSRDRTLKRLEAAHAPDAAHEVGGRNPQSSESTELADLVRTFLKELSDQQRAIMDLVDLQGMTPTEAGKVMGLRPSTARVHLLRARRRIRARILAVRPSIVEDLS